MFNKTAKIIRWTVLFGMLYTLYSITFKDTVEFNNETDEKILLQMAKDSSHSKESFKIHKQLTKLYPKNEQYKKDFDTILKQQANKLLDAHEKMLLPVAIGNYRYIKRIEFGIDKDGKYILIFNLTKLFNNKLDKTTQTQVKDMLYISHHGIYTYYGFDKGMKLLLVPIYDTKDDIKVLELDRVYKDEKKVPLAPTQTK